MAARHRTPSPPWPPRAVELAQGVHAFPSAQALPWPVPKPLEPPEPEEPPERPPTACRLRTPSPPLAHRLELPRPLADPADRIAYLERKLAEVTKDLRKAEALRAEELAEEERMQQELGARLRAPNRAPAPPSSHGSDGAWTDAQSYNRYNQLRAPPRRHRPGLSALSQASESTCASLASVPSCGSGSTVPARGDGPVRRCLSSDRDGHAAGSRGHPHCCKTPCLWFWRGLCAHGKDCEHCHRPHGDQRARLPRMNRRSRNLIEHLSFQDHLALITPLLLAKLSPQERDVVQPQLAAWERLQPRDPDERGAQMVQSPAQLRVTNVLAARPASGLVDHLRSVALKKARVGAAFLFEVDGLQRLLAGTRSRHRSASPRPAMRHYRTPP